MIPTNANENPMRELVQREWKRGEGAGRGVEGGKLRIPLGESNVCTDEEPRRV